MPENKLTRGTKAIIKQAIHDTQSNNNLVLCQKVAEILESKYSGMNMQYQLRRMSLNTTGQILHAIDEYFLKYVKSTDF